MDSKAKYGIGAALLGAFILGGVTVVNLSTAQPSAATGAAQPPAPEARAPLETSFSDLQEEEIRALVYDYLMTNPEVIIESVNEYSRRQQMAAQDRAVDGARENLARLLDPKHGYVAGAKDGKAKVAVIELFDYHCGFCKRAAPLVKSIMWRATAGASPGFSIRKLWRSGFATIALSSAADNSVSGASPRKAARKST